MSHKKSVIGSREIAQRAGVARSTVSKVINGYGDVSPQTRKKILRVIDELKYSPNFAGQLLAGKSCRTLGLFFLLQGDDGYNLSKDTIADGMIASVVQCAADLGYYTLSLIVRDNDGMRKAEEAFAQGRIDAALFIGCRLNEPVIEELTSQGRILGVFDYPVSGPLPQNLCVSNFSPQTAEKAVRYLYSLGHRKIMGIHGDQFRFDGRNKLQGFRREMENLGLEPVGGDLFSSFYLSGNLEVLTRHLDGEGEVPSAIFCANDHIAYGALLTLKSRGYDVPEDISIIGVDDAVPSRFMDPPLTTLRSDFDGMLRWLTTEVVKVVEGEGSQSRLKEFHCQIVERSSCRRVEL